jgi:predicted MFS family arabinose efflux permease
MIATILAGVDRDHSGSASGIYQAMQQIGGALGVAIMVSIASGHGRTASLEAGAIFGALAFALSVAARRTH